MTKCFKCGAIAPNMRRTRIFGGRVTVCRDVGRCGSRRHGADRWNWVGSSIDPDRINGADSELSKRDVFKNIAEGGKDGRKN